MLTKIPLTGRNVEVTFRMPPLEGVVELSLCGDFNNWHAAGAPLTQEEDGSWVVTLELEAGRSYRFRYHDNQGRWHNDWEADAYVANDFGSEDSIVDLTAMGAGVRKKPAAKKAAPRKRAPGASPKPLRGKRGGEGKKPAR